MLEHPKSCFAPTISCSSTVHTDIVCICMTYHTWIRCQCKYLTVSHTPSWQWHLSTYSFAQPVNIHIGVSLHKSVCSYALSGWAHAWAHLSISPSQIPALRSSVVEKPEHDPTYHSINKFSAPKYCLTAAALVPNIKLTCCYQKIRPASRVFFFFLPAFSRCCPLLSGSPTSHGQKGWLSYTLYILNI